MPLILIAMQMSRRVCRPIHRVACFLGSHRCCCCLRRHDSSIAFFSSQSIPHLRGHAFSARLVSVFRPSPPTAKGRSISHPILSSSTRTTRSRILGRYCHYSEHFACSRIDFIGVPHWDMQSSWRYACGDRWRWNKIYDLWRRSTSGRRYLSVYLHPHVGSTRSLIGFKSGTRIFCHVGRGL